MTRNDRNHVLVPLDFGRPGRHGPFFIELFTFDIFSAQSVNICGTAVHRLSVSNSLSVCRSRTVDDALVNGIVSDCGCVVVLRR